MELVNWYKITPSAAVAAPPLRQPNILVGATWICVMFVGPGFECHYVGRVTYRVGYGPIPT